MASGMSVAVETADGVIPLEGGGGIITTDHFEKAKTEYKIKKETIKKAKKSFSKTTYENLNNIPAFNIGKKTPLSVALKGIQRAGYVI